MKSKIFFIFIALIANCTSLDDDLLHSLGLFEENRTILSLKDAASVTFDKSFYEATYTDIKEEIDLIAVEGSIAISDTATAVTISGEYAYHFNINCLEGICQLSVKEDLPEDLLTSTRQIVIALEATNINNTERAIALVIIHLPLENIKPAPKFSQVYYVYSYSPVTNSLDVIGNRIAVTSDNNTLVAITLSDYQDSFAVAYLPEYDMWAINIIKSLDDTILYKDTELIIGLTSVLEDSDQDTATLVIKLPERGAANVTFDKIFYEAIYTAIDDRIDLITLNENIIISDANATITISGDYAGHFYVYCQTGTSCTIRLKEDLPEDTLKAEKEITIGLEASNDKNTEHSIAVILIHLPLDNIKPAPKFSNIYYIYEYLVIGNTTYLSASGDPIDIASDNNTLVQVTLSDYQDNFVVRYNSVQDYWSIAVTTILDDVTLSENSQLVISLTSVTDDSYQDTATLLITLPEKGAANVTFDRTFYEAIYTEIKDQIDLIALEEAIIISDQNATVTLSGEFAYHFTVNCQTGHCLLAVKEDLPEDTLIINREIIIGLEATNDKNTEHSIALVIIHLPLDNIKPAPKFSHPYYIYSYLINDNGPFVYSSKDPIAITSDNNTLVDVTLSDYQDNFAVIYNSETDQWSVTIKTALNDSILYENRELVISLTSVTGDSDQDIATLLIELPEKGAANVTFNKSFYESIYTSVTAKTDLITLNENIIISDPNATVTLSGDYAYHFNVNCLTGTCLITVKEDLPQKTLEALKQIIIGIEASNNKNTERSIALVIVHLPLDNIKPAPKFGQTYYIYEYKILGNLPSLVAEGVPLTITSDNIALVNVTFSNYQDNFAVTYDSETEEWSIVIKRYLDETILKENTELVVGLTGELDNSEKSAATLLIKLPKKISPNVTFGMPFYTATYKAIADRPHAIITEEVITISDSNVTVTLTGDYAFHFNISCAFETLTCQLIVYDELSESVLSSVKQIILGLEVTKDNIVEPVTAFVLITLPLGDIRPGPKFSQTYYVYEYQIVDEVASLIPNGNPIAVASDNNTLTQITLSDYQDNFAVTYDSDSDQWAIVVTAALDDTLLSENTELVTSLVGVLDDSNESTALLLIRLPKEEV